MEQTAAKPSTSLRAINAVAAVVVSLLSMCWLDGALLEPELATV